MSLLKLIQHELPLNRKERYYTGTVFPMIVCKDNFQHFNKFLDLIEGFPKVEIKSGPIGTNFQFFTEYSLVESLVGPSKTRFANLPKTKDTPDILILIKSNKNILLALEAKMFDLPNASELNLQLSNQSKILESIKTTLEIDEIYHYALLPEKLAQLVAPLKYQVLTWEMIYDTFQPLYGHDYFLEMLKIALDSYPELVSKKTTGGKNCEELLKGIDIYTLFKESLFNKVIMGRNGGFHGKILSEDIRTGSWKKQKYETSSATQPPSSNWFLIKDFVKLIDDK